MARTQLPNAQNQEPKQKHNLLMMRRTHDVCVILLTCRPKPKAGSSAKTPTAYMCG